MIKKRLENKEEEATEVTDESKSKKTLSMTTNMVRLFDKTTIYNRVKGGVCVVGAVPSFDPKLY